MRMKVRTITVILLICAAAPECFSQGPGGVATICARVQEGEDALKNLQPICDQQGSPFVKAECANLVMEFCTNKYAISTGLKETLHDPFGQLGPFIAGVREKAFDRIANHQLDNYLSSIAQAALNNAEQALSTKAAVSQTGASSNSSGATNLVTKPTTTDLISLAAESGAFTDTVNGNTLTAQANANGLRRYLDGKPFADLSPSSIDFLNHINFTATFAVAQNGSTGVSTSGSATSTTPSIAGIILPSRTTFRSTRSLFIIPYIVIVIIRIRVTSRKSGWKLLATIRRTSLT